MGTIQSSINQMLGTVAGAAAAGKHLKQQQIGIEAANAADQEIVETNEKALEADQFEAQQAILAHSKDEGLSEDEVYRLEKDPAYANTLRDTVLKERRQENLSVASDKYNEAKPGLQKYRAGKQLEKAYTSLRELNDRIAATRQLKFNIASAQARLKARGVK